MANPDPLNERERDDLTAYLDGELDRQSARALEAKLGVSPEARREADAMRRTWEMLDYLPRPEPSPDFTHRTLDRLTAASLASTAGLRDSTRPWFFRTGWAAAALIAAFVGYAGMDRYLQRGPVDPDRQLVQDLHLI